jgi:uncharacterized protein YbaP (TraB family)
MNDTPITFSLSRENEIALMRVCVADGMTINEKLNALVDAFLRGEVKLTAVETSQKVA